MSGHVASAVEPSGGFGWGGLLAQHRPSYVRTQFFAPDGAASSAFDRWTALGWHFTQPLAPLVDSGRRHVEGSRHLGLATQSGASPGDWRKVIAHVLNVAPLHDCCKAVLHDQIDSIAVMPRHWTQQEEAEHLARRFDGVNQAAFAREFGVPGGASMVSQHIKGRRPINMDAALAYMKGFGVPLAEISPRLAEQMSKALRELEKSKLPSAAPMRNVRPVWVVGRTQGGMPERVWTDGDHPVGVTDKYAEVSTTDPLAFACRVVGDSMVPRYMPGEFALVEPSVLPELEDDVLVRLTSGETMIKRLLSRRGGVRLGSYNSAETLTFDESEISWMYYVAHPIPTRRIKQRVDVELDVEQHHEEPGEVGPQTVYGDLPPAFGEFIGGESQFGDLPAAAEKPKENRRRGSK